MPDLICPICKSGLARAGNAYRCRNGHCYDRAKSGYVNLLMSQNKKDKRHGDDKAMVLARTRFLEGGHYQILLEALLGAVRRYAVAGCSLLDLGCGEGFYSGSICQTLANEGTGIFLMGVDISKDAVKAFSRRSPEAEAVVASTFRLPVASGSCRIVMSVFAPFQPGEVQRILAPGGAFIRAYPLEKHLLSLKKLIYEQVYENKPPARVLAGFELKESNTVKGALSLTSGEDIRNLFMMTPYFYKTSRAGQEKLLALDQLTTEIEFGVDVYEICDIK